MSSICKNAAPATRNEPGPACKPSCMGRMRYLRTRFCGDLVRAVQGNDSASSPCPPQFTERKPTEGGSPHIAEGWQRVPRAYMTVLPMGKYLLSGEPSFSLTPQTPISRQSKGRCRNEKKNKQETKCNMHPKPSVPIYYSYPKNNK